MFSVNQRLGATLAESLPVELGSPDDRRELSESEWQALTRPYREWQVAQQPSSLWAELLKVGKEYLLTKEQIEAAKRAAEAKTAIVPPTLPPKSWLEKNFGWIIGGGLLFAVLTTLALKK